MAWPSVPSSIMSMESHCNLSPCKICWIVCHQSLTTVCMIVMRRWELSRLTSRVLYLKAQTTWKAPKEWCWQKAKYVNGFCPNWCAVISVSLFQEWYLLFRHGWEKWTRFTAQHGENTCTWLAVYFLCWNDRENTRRFYIGVHKTHSRSQPSNETHEAHQVISVALVSENVARWWVSILSPSEG